MNWMAVNLRIMNICCDKIISCKTLVYILFLVILLFFFHSAKFSSKLRFVRSLSELGQIIPMEYIFVPELVQQWVQQPQGWIQDICFLNQSQGGSKIVVLQISLRGRSKIVVFQIGHRGGSKTAVSFRLLYLKSVTRLDLMIVVL